MHLMSRAMHLQLDLQVAREFLTKEDYQMYNDINVLSFKNVAFSRQGRIQELARGGAQTG